MAELSYTAGTEIAPGTTVYTLLQAVCKAPFQMTTFTVMPGNETPIDKHQVKEIWLIQSGSGELRVEEQKYQANANDVFYFDSYKKHQIKNIGNHPLYILSIYW